VRLDIARPTVAQLRRHVRHLDILEPPVPRLVPGSTDEPAVKDRRRGLAALETSKHIDRRCIADDDLEAFAAHVEMRNGTRWSRGGATTTYEERDKQQGSAADIIIPNVAPFV
jgi:hypothetical protein